VEDDVLRAAQGFERARDQVLTALAEDLDCDVGRDAVFLNEAAAEIELDLGSGGETDLDLLKADFHQEVEVLEFLLDAHGLSEGLVAIAEIDAAPDGRVGERAARPLAVGQIDRRERPVLGNGRRLHGQNGKELTAGKKNGPTIKRLRPDPRTGRRANLGNRTDARISRSRPSRIVRLGKSKRLTVVSHVA
jgi:hypothetical protein